MPTRAGKLRPSQAVTQYGPGSLVDLPSMSMVVGGIDDWDTSTARRVEEPRLAAKLDVAFFRRPPFFIHRQGIGGVPARIFPKYLVCPRCGRLAHHTSFNFDESRPEYTCTAAHAGSARAVVFPARFMVACPRGHLDDFPWTLYVHGDDVECRDELKLRDSGKTGAITDLWVRCNAHNVSKNLGQAMGVAARRRLPRCTGNRPWLGPAHRQQCGEEIHVILRGASNAYFPVVESAISVPPWSDPIQLALGEYVDQLAKVDSADMLRMWLKLSNAPELEEFEPDRLWDALERRRSGEIRVEDLRREEWESFTGGHHHSDPKSQFQVKPAPVPEEVADILAGVTQVLRLREVRALRGFTRIDPIPDIGDLGEVAAIDAGLAPIAAKRRNWLPGIDLRGEGVFIRLDEEKIQAWEQQSEIRGLEAAHGEAQRRWYEARQLSPPNARPARYLLLHSIAHLLIRQFGLDCGYASASLRERLYSATGPNPMAGILIYTAGPDSEGSLGGLVEMSRPELLGPILDRALREARLCANDPLCADREPGATGTQLNGAACHACLLQAETSCETGNNYLDRALVTGTLRKTGTAFAERS